MSTRTSTSLYRQLAADGNQHAKRIADELGAMPGMEMSTAETSESLELAELEGLEAHLQTLIARAEVAAAGDSMGEVARAHFERGQSHEMAAGMLKEAGAGDRAMAHDRSARDAYRDAAMALGTHVNKFGKDCGYAEGYSLPQIKAIHWKMNQE